jgi:alpha-galactosidase
MYRVTRAGTLAAAPASGTLQVSDLSWLASSNGWGPAERDRSNGEQAAGDGRAINIGGTTFAKGIGVHADSAIHVYVGRTCRTFNAQVGIDAESGSNGSVRFAVYGDGLLLGYTVVKSGAQAPTRLAVSTAGYLTLELRVTDARNGINYDHADWGSPTLVCGGTGTGSFASDRTWSSFTNDWGPAERDQSNGEQLASDGSVQAVNGAFYPKGIGVHAASDVAIAVSGCSRFAAVLGVDAETTGRGSVAFSLVADGVTIYTSPTVTSTSPVQVDADISGRTTLHLIVGDGGDGKGYDHADWADARLLC